MYPQIYKMTPLYSLNITLFTIVALKSFSESKAKSNGHSFYVSKIKECCTTHLKCPIKQQIDTTKQIGVMQIPLEGQVLKVIPPRLLMITFWEEVVSYGSQILSFFWVLHNKGHEWHKVSKL